MGEEIPLHGALLDGTVVEEVPQGGIVVLQTLVQKGGLERLLPPVLVQEEGSGKKQEQGDDAQEQMTAKLGHIPYRYIRIRAV